MSFACPPPTKKTNLHSFVVIFPGRQLFYADLDFPSRDIFRIQEKAVQILYRVERLACAGAAYMEHYQANLTGVCALGFSAQPDSQANYEGNGTTPRAVRAL
jgi:hypothetical protein